MEGEIYETASLNAGADEFILKQTPVSDFFSRLREHVMIRGATQDGDYYRIRGSSL